MKADWRRVDDRQGLITTKDKPEYAAAHLALDGRVRCV
jgi:hypothetical protein